MPPANMPSAEVDVDEGLVQALLEEQHPDLAGLPVSPLAFGWDNVVFRLGDGLVARLPRREMSARLVEHEQRWLPVLEIGLPLPIPTPVRVGQPGLGYPWSWSVCPWMQGEIAATNPPADSRAAAETVGRFVRAFRRDAPPDAPSNPYRGVPLAERATRFEEHAAHVAGMIDHDAALHRWGQALQVEPWHGSPQWLHGDLHPANVLVASGRVSGIIDFGDLTAGDPATDLFVAWMMFDDETRQGFRVAAGAEDEAMWARGRGWALAMAVAILANSNDHPVLAAVARRTLREVLADDSD